MANLIDTLIANFRILQSHKSLKTSNFTKQVSNHTTFHLKGKHNRYPTIEETCYIQTAWQHAMPHDNFLPCRFNGDTLSPVAVNNPPWRQTANLT